MPQIIKQNTTALLLAGLLVLVAGCSSQNKVSPIDPDTGKHPANWIVDHRTAFLKDQAACYPCHGTDLRGGSSGVSCFSASFGGLSCHANGPSGHPLGWTAPDLHGTAAKSAYDPAALKGYTTCGTCHGPDFAGGFANVTCLNVNGCHGSGIAAPHPAAPWRDGARTHTSTDPGNAGSCALCHLDNRTPATYLPVPPGTQPGCFNNTLCHGMIGHPAGWSLPAQHGLSAEQDFAVCTTCHGATYQGGTAGTTCFQCHNGPGLDHPAASWVIANHKTAATASNTGCRTCHGADFLGGGSHIACNSCHMENETKVHMLNWYPDVRLNHRAYAKANGTSACATSYCHGLNLTGVTGSGPSCSTCHTWPFTASACGSCHGIPPAGTAFPDAAGKHAVHAALASSVTCDTCHLNAGSGTLNHQDGATDVAMTASYSGKTGTASFNSTGKICSTVSCHGGQTTPSWLTGSIAVDTQCTSCHTSGTTQYNGYSSGRHSLHVGKGFGCTECHDTAKLASVHFNDLDTTAMTEDWKTLLASLNYTGTATAAGSCTLTCHGKSHSSFRW